MTQKRVQKSLVEQFFYTFMNKGIIIEWEERLGENYQKEYDPAGRYSEDTVFNEQFLRSLGMRELQRLNRSISGSSIPQGGNKEFAIEEIMAKIGVQNVVEERPSVGTEVYSEGNNDGDNSELVIPFDPMSEFVLNSENTVTGMILAKLDQLQSKLGIVIEMLSSPIFAAQSVGVDQVDLKIPVAAKLSTADIKLLSIEDLRKFAEQLGLPNAQYHTVLRESVLKEHARLHRIVEVSDKFLISTARAEKALLMSEQTGVSLEKAVQVC